jgi:anti-sigma regulatory factor (Ser/Thr protein kinase)
LASTVKASGVVINCQKVNDPDWKRADMVSVGKGMLADGIGCFSSGLLGGMGTSMSAANVGLSMATGATSRRIGYFIGFFFLLLSPQLDAGAEVYRFLENQGATWGARQQVIHEAKHILRELIEAVYMHAKTNGPVHIEALFDEYNLNIDVTYKGEPMEFPGSPPTEDELMLDKSSLARMSGFMIQFMAEKVTSTVNSNLCRVTIYITH